MSTRRKKRILFVQIEDFHAEVLGPQLEILEQKYDLYLFLSPCLINDDLINIYDAKIYSAANIKLKGIPVFFRKIFTILIYLKNIIKLLFVAKKAGIDLIVFNTITDIRKTQLIGFLFKGFRKILIIHNAEEYLHENKLFRLFNKILFLSEEVYEYCSTHSNLKYKDRLDYFIPIFFTKYFTGRDSISASANENIVVIGIVGKTDSTKRNYSGLLKTLSKYRGVDQKFRILVTGAVLNSFISLIEEYDLDSFISYVPGFQTFSNLFRDIERSDILLFLIDSSVKFFDKYNKVKISGTTNMAKAFCKPVAYSEKFRTGKYLSKMGISYNKLEEFLDRIQSGEITKDSIEVMRNKKSCEEYKKNQAEHYREMIRTLLLP